MRATFNWAAPAILLALAAGCSQDGGSTTKAPSPAPSKAVPVSADNQVVLKVDGMT